MLLCFSESAGIPATRVSLGALFAAGPCGLIQPPSKQPDPAVPALLAPAVNDLSFESIAFPQDPQVMIYDTLVLERSTSCGAICRTDCPESSQCALFRFGRHPASRISRYGMEKFTKS